MTKDILGSQLVIGDIILFHSTKKKGMYPGRLLDIIKGDCIAVERGYFLKSGEAVFFNEPEIYVIFSTETVKLDFVKVPKDI